MKTITIFLTKYSDMLSNFIYIMSGGWYTHVSLALNDIDEPMYSFNFKGFCVETIEKHRRRGVTKSMSYRLSVTDNAYDRLKLHIHRFIEHQDEFSYTKFGAIMCFLRIPFKWNGHYFCSQFVAEALKSTDAIALKKPSCLYLPNHLKNELERSKQLKLITYNPV